jgi:2'-5' RNA ligase
MAKSIRTFVAVYASQKLNANIARLIERFANKSNDLNWVLQDNLHLPLNFVGDVPDQEIPELLRDITDTVRDFEPFELTLSGLDGFPNLAKPRNLWIGAEQGGDEMETISKSVGQLLRDWNFGKSRFTFEPQMTIARLKRGCECSEELSQLIYRFRNHDAGSCHVDKVVVCSSTFEGGRPQYAPMATIRLEG